MGKPNVLPAYQESPSAWSPAVSDGRADEWLQVAFAKPQKAAWVAVAESWGAGAITQVIAFGPAGQRQLIYQDWRNEPLPERGRLLQISCPPLPFPIESLQLVLSTVDVPGWNQIDAVGLSNSPVSVGVEVAESLRHGSAEALPMSVNSEYDEVMPVLEPDGMGLFFVRKRHPAAESGGAPPNDDIWHARQQSSGAWEVSHLGKPLNDAQHNFVASVLPDGNTLLLGNRPLFNAQQTLAMSRRTAAGWTPPNTLEIKDHYNWSRTEEFCLGGNGRTLILAVLRRDSEGEKDLYVSFADSAGGWSVPRHMGPAVNSPADEAAPFLAADGRTLYFASKGHSGYGHFDLYMSRRLDSTWTSWSEPKNLGPAFNTSASDVCFAIDPQGNYAYFCSSRFNFLGVNDIFRMKLPHDMRPDPIVLVSGRVRDGSNGRLLGAQILYEQFGTGKPLGEANSKEGTGYYQIALPLHEAYSFYASAPGYLSQEDRLNLTDGAFDGSQYALVRDLDLVPLAEGSVLLLNNVFFEQSKAVLLPASYPELQRLAVTLQANPRMEITLEGHTDIEGSASKNMKLSKERVEVVRDYLIRLGIAPERIGLKAYGGTRPLSRERTPAAMQANRRVEVRITRL